MSEPLPSPIGIQGRASESVASAPSFLPPVVARELQVALHRRDARNSRSRIARYGVIGVSLFMLFGAVMGTATWGGTLHFYLFLAGLGLAIAPALQMSVGLFAEERRQQTLELLYLTGMGSAELFVGKLLGGVLVSSSELLALAPLVAVPFLSGGVSFELFLATAVCLPTVFILVLAVGSLASALCRQEGAALVFSGVLMGIWCLALPLPYNLGFWLAGKVPFDKAWLVFSPAVGPWMIARNFAGFRISDFWVWTTVAWSGSVVCLLLAALVLERNWRRDLQGACGQGWQARWEAFVLGHAGWREALRQRVLAVNAYQWLAQQDRRPVLQAWSFIAGVCAFWLLGWLAWPHLWPSPLNFFTTAMVLLFGIDRLMLHAAARRMATDRQDGALELLLTTRLNPDEILAGQKAALREQFRPVKQCLCGLLLVMMVAGFFTRNWTRQGVVSYLAAWGVFFAWCWRPAQRSAPLAMWVAANCGRPLYAAFRTAGPWNRTWAIYWVWMASNSFGVFGGVARSFPSGSTLEMMITLAVAFWLLLFMVATSKLSNSMADSLISQLRSIAQEPLPERNDARFKEWKDIRTRLPAPPGGRSLDAGADFSPTKPIRAAGAWFWRPVGRSCGLVWGKLRKAAANR